MFLFLLHQVCLLVMSSEEDFDNAAYKEYEDHLYQVESSSGLVKADIKKYVQKDVLSLLF